jgi:hypothetical protein
MATFQHKTHSQRPSFLNVFMIIGQGDKSMFFCDLSSDGFRDDSPHLDEFIIHAALDNVDSMKVCVVPIFSFDTPQAYTSDSFLRTVDRFNDFSVVSYAGAGDIRMMMLHKSTNEESIRLFFQDVYHMVTKKLMNPFYCRGSRIDDATFERTVREIARQTLVPIGV